MRTGRTPDADRRPPTPRTSRATTLVIIAAAAALYDKVALADEAIALASAVIRGSTVYTPADLFPLYSDQLGKPLTAASAQAVAARVAELYRDAGYAQPRVSVDTGLAELGVLRIDVAEARVADVMIRG